MKSCMAFFEKECMEIIRSGKLFLLTIIFILFGIMNPAMAKLTPWIMEVAAESLEGTGLLVTEVTVDAMTSWTQYYKNVPLAIIIFLLMFSSILTLEYQKGTLVNMVTRGLARWKIVAAKTLTVILLWTVLYWLCFGITYGYNSYFWDNRIAENIFFAAFCLYLLGIWLYSLVMLFSVLTSTGSAVVLLTGAVFGGAYILSLVTKLKEYLPVKLMEALGLLSGMEGTADYGAAVAVCCVWTVMDIAAAILLFNRKRI